MSDTVDVNHIIPIDENNYEPQVFSISKNLNILSQAETRGSMAITGRSINMYPIKFATSNEEKNLIENKKLI